MANEFRIKNGAITPDIVVTDTTVSTSKTTGAVQVAGGVGIGGNVYANAFYGSGSGLTSIPGANVSGEVLTANTVSNPSQSNITSVGTLTGLTSNGNITMSTTTGKITLTSFAGGDLRIGLEDGTVTTPMISFKTGNGGGTSVRFIASGGNVAYGRGNLEIISANTTFTSGNVFASKFYASAGSGDIAIDGSSSSIAMGRKDNVSSTPTIEFNSGSTSTDYDARILCSGGTGSNNGGDLAVTASTFYIGAKFGYRTGMGLSVTQLTSRTTGVTINALSGRITLVSATTTAGQVSTFTVTNSYMTSTDTILITQVSGSGHYIVTPKSASSGSFSLNVYTPTAISSAEAPAFNFAIIRGTIT